MVGPTTTAQAIDRPLLDVYSKTIAQLEGLGAGVTDTSSDRGGGERSGPPFKGVDTS